MSDPSPASLPGIADPAAAAIHDLALLSRPAITNLDIDDLDHLTRALADLAAALPQTLDQLRRYLPTASAAPSPLPPEPGRPRGASTSQP